MRKTPLKGELTKARILESASELFAKNGYADTTFQEVADAAKVPKTLITHYFSNKYGLFHVCVLNVLKIFSEILAETSDESEPPLVRLERNFEANLILEARNSEAVRLMIIFYSLATHQKEFRALNESVTTGVRARYSALLKAGVREKIFKLEADPESIAELFHEAIVGGMIFLSAKASSKTAIPQIRTKWKFLISAMTGSDPKSFRVL